MRRLTTALLAAVLAVMLAGPAGASQSAWGWTYCGHGQNPYVESYSIGVTEHFSPGWWNYGFYINDVWTVRRTYSGVNTWGGDWLVEVIGDGSLNHDRTFGACE